MIFTTGGNERFLIDYSGNIGSWLPSRRFIVITREQYFSIDALDFDKQWSHIVSAGSDVAEWIQAQDSSEWSQKHGHTFWITEQLLLLLSLKWQRV